MAAQPYTKTFCSGSPETVGDIIPIPASPKGASIADMNAVWIGTGGGIHKGNMVVGWMSRTSDGTTLFQLNFENQAAWCGSAGVTLGTIFGGGMSVSTPGGYGPIKKWNGMMAPSGTSVECETKGADSVSSILIFRPPNQNILHGSFDQSLLA